MKLLELPVFERINALLNEERQNCHVESKIESYSCKMVGDDKKLLRELSNGRIDCMLPLSPPEDHVFAGVSPNKTCASSRHQSHNTSCCSSDEDQQCNPDGATNPLSLVLTCCVKTHFYLVSTLNKSFYPDYDFSNAPSTDFCRELNLNTAMATVDNLLLTLGGSYYSSFRPKLWEEIDREIQLKECEIYKYSPDLNSGPFSEPGVLWSFNYFFYNKKLKRIVYICCIARSGYSSSENDAGCLEDEQNEDIADASENDQEMVFDGTSILEI